MEQNREEAVEFFNNLEELISNIKKDIEKTEDLSVDTFPANNLFRAFHSIKMNSKILGYEKLCAFCQLAGDMILKIRIGSIKFDDRVRQILLKAAEILSAASASIKNQQNEGMLDKDEIEDSIRQVSEQATNLYGLSKTGIQVVLKEERKKPLKLRSLVVEDEFVSRNMLLDFLSQYGRCDVAINGSEAVAAFKEAFKKEGENSYNLICMDILMPETDGMEAARMIRQIESENGVPAYSEANIIMITALGDPKTVINSYYNCGATSYLVKPINLKRLKVELEKLGII